MASTGQNEIPGNSSNRCCSRLERELLFLVARYLESGPCQEAAKALKRELVENELLPKRVDWEGNEHFRSFENLVDVNFHLMPDHLLQICNRIGPLLDKEIKPNVIGVKSLLGAGKQSLLRTIKEVESTRWPATALSSCLQNRLLTPPHNVVSQSNLYNVIGSKQLTGLLPQKKDLSCTIYSKITQLSRSLGHLSAVYCVMFDRSGNFFITGADDHLLKIWSSISGRLLATLRGHSAEITDLSVNYENTLLASGSCDKIIRVWCLKTVSPVAVLHGHSGAITSLAFCPYVNGDQRYLMSTGADGCVCFWQWSVDKNTFNSKPLKFIERSRAGAQMLCSSFSPGGIFLTTGNKDHVIRVYRLATTAPEKICELEAHTEQVDSIQYANKSDRFLSGSKDGTARIWRFERQEWKFIVLDMKTCKPDSVNGSNSNSGNEVKKPDMYVTMVSWTCDDDMCITADNELALKLWNSHNGHLVHVLKGHEDEAFVLEINPIEPRILLSAGHDGNIILWDISTAKILKKFFNMIEGQGHGAVFDCKWSPDGQSFVATDSHGFSMLFGFGSEENFKILPEHMFFHTDYRPLIRDANSYVLDEQTQQPPHLMPPPFLVDIDGNPQPSHLQRLVPGREKCKYHQLVPQIGVTPSGDREVLDDVLQLAAELDAEPQAGPSNELLEESGPSNENVVAAEPSNERVEEPGPSNENAVAPGPSNENAVVPVSSNENAVVPGSSNENAVVPGPSNENAVVPGPSDESAVIAGPSNESAEQSSDSLTDTEQSEESEVEAESSGIQGRQHEDLDTMIEQLQRRRDVELGVAVEESVQPDERQPVRRESQAGLMSPSHVPGMRRAGEMEGVRQVSGNVPVSQRATERDIADRRKRIVIRDLHPAILRASMQFRQIMADEEVKKFIVEAKKKPLPPSENDSSDSSTLYMKTRHKQKPGHRPRRLAPNEARARDRLTTRALYDTEDEEETTEGTDDTGIRERRTQRREVVDTSQRDQGEESDKIWSSSSDSDSSEYSDWIEDAGLNMQPPKRSQRKPKKKKVPTATLR